MSLDKSVTRRLTIRVMRRIIDLHRAGMSVPKIASLIWREYGYTCQKTCENAIYNRMRALGYRPAGRCKGCGVSRDERTPGCDTCRTRHSYRRIRAREKC
jgi:hypothetical protein